MVGVPRSTKGSAYAACLAVIAGPSTAACGGDGNADVARSPQPVLCPLHPSAEDQFDARALLGSAERRAKEVAERHGCRFRVVQRDGRPVPGNADMNLRRINAVVEEGRVVRVSVG